GESSFDTEHGRAVAARRSIHCLRAPSRPRSRRATATRPPPRGSGRPARRGSGAPGAGRGEAAERLAFEAMADTVGHSGDARVAWRVLVAFGALALSQSTMPVG